MSICPSHVEISNALLSSVATETLFIITLQGITSPASSDLGREALVGTPYYAPLEAGLHSIIARKRYLFQPEMNGGCRVSSKDRSHPMGMGPHLM